MVEYEDSGKFAYFDNLKFTKDDKTGYYLNSTIGKRLHRYVWEFFNGLIPNGYFVHHKDGDKNNNGIENLALIKPSKHATLHGIENSLDKEWLERARRNMDLNARPAASRWHGSEEGKKWHAEQYEKVKDKMFAREIKKCDHCGEGGWYRQ